MYFIITVRGKIDFAEDRRKGLFYILILIGFIDVITLLQKETKELAIRIIGRPAIFSLRKLPITAGFRKFPAIFIFIKVPAIISFRGHVVFLLLG